MSIFFLDLIYGPHSILLASPENFTSLGILKPLFTLPFGLMAFADIDNSGKATFLSVNSIVNLCLSE